METDNKISFTLEMTDGIQNENANNFFISGPIDIYAIADTLSELYTDDLKTAIRASLIENPELSIIVFVKNSFKEEPDGVKSGNLKYRGSYYKFLEFDDSDNLVWTEVGIGTHVHDNKAILDKITDVDVENLELDKENLIVIKKISDNDFEFSFSSGQLVPSLPDYILSIIEKNKNSGGSDIEEYFNDIYNHLDAGIDELTWISNPEDPNHPAQVYGHCQKLFEAIYGTNESIFLTRTDDFLEETLRNSIKIVSFNRNSEESNPYSQELFLKEQSILFKDLIKNPYDDSKYITSFDDFEFDQSKGDYFVVFLNESIVPLNKFSYVYNSSEKQLNLNLDKDLEYNTEENIENLISVLIIKNLPNHPETERIYIDEFYKNVELNKFSLDDLKNLFFNIYLKKKISRKQTVPKTYLSNDEDGNLVWDNKFLPANTFKTIKKEFKYIDSEIVVHEFFDKRKENAVVLKVSDVSFDSQSIPLIMFDNMFIFDGEYYVNGNEMTLWIPSDRPYFDDSNEKFTISLLIVYNGAQSVLESLASDYVSKKELVEYLSHGKLSLDKYATKTDLRNKASYYHTHSAYSNIDHTHDFRYADYHHTHSDLATKADLWAALQKNPEEIAKIETLSELINSLIKSAFEGDSGYFEQIKKMLINDCGFTKVEDETGEWFYFSGRNIYFDNVLSDAGQALINYVYEENPDNLSKVRLDEILLKIINDIQDKLIPATDVIISDSIEANLDVGGIKKGTVYPEGTDVESILKDLIQPYISAEEILKKLIPVQAKISFYKNIGSDEEINLEKIECLNAALDSEDYLKTVDVYLSLDDYINQFDEIIEPKPKIKNIEFILDDDLPILFEEVIVSGKIYFKILNLKKEKHRIDIKIIFYPITAEDNYKNTDLTATEENPKLNQSEILYAQKASYIMGNLYYNETIKEKFDSLKKVYRINQTTVFEDILDEANPIYDYYVIAYRELEGSPEDIISVALNSSIKDAFETDETLFNKDDSKLYGEDYDYIYFKFLSDPNKSQKAQIKIIFKK